MNKFNVIDFGAVPDGVTDSTGAIQAALDKASVSGGDVIIPSGRFSVSRLHLKGKSVALIGTAAWGFNDDGGSVLILNDPNVDCLLDITGGFGCSVRGISFNGQKLGENIHGIKLYWDKYNGGSEEDSPTIDECRIGSFTGDGVHFEHVWCFTLRHSMLHRNYGAGLFIDGWDAFILDNWITANRGGGITGGETACSITATGNRIEWNKTAGVLIPDGCCINLTGNYIDRSFGPAVNLGGGKNVDAITMTGNIFYRSGALKDGDSFSDEYLNSHIYMTGVKGVTITGNSFRIGRSDGGKGNISPNYSVVMGDSENCVIMGNTLYNGQVLEPMIEFGKNKDCVISGNTGNR